MDKTELFSFFSTVLSGVCLSLIFPDGRYKKYLKMLLFMIIILSLLSFSFNFEMPDFSFESETENMKNILSRLAVAEVEDCLEKLRYKVDEISVGVVETADGYYIEGIYLDGFEGESEEIKKALSRRFYIPEINVIIKE